MVILVGEITAKILSNGWDSNYVIYARYLLQVTFIVQGLVGLGFGLPCQCSATDRTTATTQHSFLCLCPYVRMQLALTYSTVKCFNPPTQCQ